MAALRDSSNEISKIRPSFSSTPSSSADFESRKNSANDHECIEDENKSSPNNHDDDDGDGDGDVNKRGPNIIILSRAGKPIFVRHPHRNTNSAYDEDHGEGDTSEWVTTLCGLIQALRANATSFGSDFYNKTSGEASLPCSSPSSLGDIRSLTVGGGYKQQRRTIVFLSTEALTLVAISNGNKQPTWSKHNEYKMCEVNDDQEIEAWLRLQLEYTYAQVIFTLTNQVQTIFQNSPNYDLRSMLGSSGSASLRDLLDRFDDVDKDGEMVKTRGMHSDLYQDSEQLRDDCSTKESSGDDAVKVIAEHNDIPSSSSMCASFLTSGIECIFPLAPDLRDAASQILVQAASSNKFRRRNLKLSRLKQKHRQPKSEDEDNGALFAILMAGTQLLTLVQPSSRSSQLHTSDLHLILTFIGRPQKKQPTSLRGELWFPLCLPRFDSSGFLYAYANCLDVSTKLSIVLISPHNTPTQFEYFRNAAATVRSKLGLPSLKTGVLRVYDSALPAANINNTAVNSTTLKIKFPPGKPDFQFMTFSAESEDSEQRHTHFDYAVWKSQNKMLIDDDDDDDGENNGRGIVSRIHPRDPLIESDEDLVERRLSGSDEKVLDAAEIYGDNNVDGPLMKALKEALSMSRQRALLNEYLQLADAIHFVFRCDVYVGTPKNDKYFSNTSGGSGNAHANDHNDMGGMLTQTLSPPLSFPSTSPSLKRRIWSTYLRLSLRLRLGSSTVETTMDALDMINEAQSSNNKDYDYDARGISRDCPITCLMENPPLVHGVTYFHDGECLFVGLNGKFFELYATLPGAMAPRNGAAYCARLVRRLMGDERMLFLANPLTWDSLC